MEPESESPHKTLKRYFNKEGRFAALARAMMI